MERENWDEPRSHQNGRGEAEVVPTFQLAEQVEIFIKKWHADRPQYETLGRTFHNEKESIFMGALDWLEDETARLGCRVNVRFIHRIRKCVVGTTPFSKAEALLMAMDREYMLKTGEIQIVPNPNWSLQKWIDYMSQRGCI